MPQYTSHDVFVGGVSPVIVMSHRISRDGGTTWSPLDPRVGVPTRVAVSGGTLLTYAPAAGLMRFDPAGTSVAAVTGAPTYTNDGNWRVDPATGKFAVFDGIDNEISLETATGWKTASLPQPTPTETQPYIQDLESNGSTLLTISGWGVHRSRDGGMTWQLVTNTVPDAGRDLLVLGDGRFLLFGGMTSYVFDATGVATGTVAGVVADQGDASACADGAIVVHDKRSTDLGATWHPLIASGDLSMIVERIGCAGDTYWMLARSDAWGYRLVKFQPGAAQLAAGDWETDPIVWAPDSPQVLRMTDGTFLAAGLAWRDGDPAWSLRVLPGRAWSSGSLVLGVDGSMFYASADGGATWTAEHGTGPAPDQVDGFARTADGAVLVSTFVGSGDASGDHWHAEVWRSTDMGASWTSIYTGDASRPAGGEITGEAHRFVGVTEDGTWVATDGVSHDSGATWDKSNVENDHSAAFLTPHGRILATLPGSSPDDDLWRFYDDGGAGKLVGTYTLQLGDTPVQASALASVAFDEDGYAYVAGGAPYVQLWKSTKPVDAP